MRINSVMKRSAIGLWSAALVCSACSGARAALQGYTGHENPVLCYRVIGSEQDASLIAALKVSLGKLSSAGRSVLECDDAECMAKSDATRGCELSVFVRVTDYTFTVPPRTARQAKCTKDPAVEELIDYRSISRGQYTVLDHAKQSTVASGAVNAEWSDQQSMGVWRISAAGGKGEQCGWGAGNSEGTMRDRLSRYLAGQMVEQITNALPKPPAST